MTATLSNHLKASPKPPQPREMIAAEDRSPRAGDLDDLRELMRAVTATAERAQATHAALQHEVARLQRELAEANAALRRSQALAALGEVAAGIAHEVRNPLGSIQLYAQMLGEDLADRPAQSQLCAKIQRAVIGLDAIVRDVLSFARNTAISPQPVDVEELVSRSIAACDSMLIGVEVAREIPPSLQIEADANLLVQAISNIIRNAIEAMSESNSPRRQLHIAASRAKIRCPDGRTAQRIVIAMRDTGPGIPAQVVDRIFNPFFTTRKTGTGLGLAIVHRIVDAHGGHVNIRSHSHGGAVIEICLPPRVSADQSRLAKPVQSHSPESLNLHLQTEPAA